MQASALSNYFCGINVSINKIIWGLRASKGVGDNYLCFVGLFEFQCSTRIKCFGIYFEKFQGNLNR